MDCGVGDSFSWEGSGLDEVGINANTGAVVIRIDQNYYRPAEVDYLCGDASKALRDLGWESKTTFRVRRDSCAVEPQPSWLSFSNTRDCRSMDTYRILFARWSSMISNESIAATFTASRRDTVARALTRARTHERAPYWLHCFVHLFSCLLLRAAYWLARSWCLASAASASAASAAATCIGISVVLTTIVRVLIRNIMSVIQERPLYTDEILP